MIQTPRIRFHTLLIIICALILMLLSACAGQGATDSTIESFAGRVDSSEAFIGLSVSGSQVLAYLCDSSSLSEWFRGEVQEGQPLNLTSASGARLEADLTETAVQGTVTLADGAALPFTAVPASGPAGLFRDELAVDGATYVAGWIVLPDGEQRGALTLSAADAKSPSVAGSAASSTGNETPPILPAPTISPDDQKKLQELRESLFLNEEKS